MHLNTDGARDGGSGSSSNTSGVGGGGCSGPASIVDGQQEQCRFPKLEECAHFHYERVQLPPITVSLQTNMERSLHSQHSQEDDCEWYMVQVTSGDECWLLQRNFENFQLLDSQLHQCIYDRKISQLLDLGEVQETEAEAHLVNYLKRFTAIADNSINCGPVLNWLQMDNKGHRLLVPSEESRSINTPAVAAAYSVRRYVSQARDELNLEVGDMISVIDMASPGESIWWRGKRGFQVGFFPQHCVHIIGDKVPRNMPLPAPVVGTLALSPIKPVLRKHGKLIAFFRSFILNRPSRRRLKQSGILRERVFGCDLGEHLLNSGCEIPTVLKCCAEFIETHGIVDGIYRLSGVTSNIQKLRNAFDEDRIPNLYTEDILQDIHSVASLLKMYFRELPNPLCTYQLYQSFVHAVQGCTSTRNTQQDHDQLLKMREAVRKLPPPHYRTLEYLTRHLANVAKHGVHTGMTVRNVAIVWAPNLLRCAELEVGGVAALQGVGVQAVVTQFLICYADLIFCDNLNSKLNISDADPTQSITSPKRCRPKSLAISTPTKLITLEEARNKHHKDAYIEVGGGPDTLPKKYHTIIDLPMRKRVNSKRSPLGWRSLFGKSRNRSAKPTIVHHVNIEDDQAKNNKSEVKIVLRTVKSAESLSDLDQLPPLQNVLSTKPPGHNRSVSHDSYFDTLQSSQEGSLLDLSEIQVNFDLEESEMRIFSEDESLVSSPRVQPRRIRISSATNSGNPSPKKQPRVILSPDPASRKRTRLEEQLNDIQFIDCNTPEMVNSTIVQVHQVQEGPRNKSPRNSQCLDGYRRDSSRRNSTNENNRLSQVMLTSTCTTMSSTTPQSPTPQSPTYKLLESSAATTPESPRLSLVSPKSPKSPTYENVLTTINITYKSPTKTKSFIETPANYEVVTVKAEDAQVPTSTANLPLQEAKILDVLSDKKDAGNKSEELSLSTSLGTINDLEEASNLLEIGTTTTRSDTNEDEDSFPKCDTTLSELIDSYDRIAKATSGDWSHISAHEEIEASVLSNPEEFDKVDCSTTAETDDDVEGDAQASHSYENIASAMSEDNNYENMQFHTEVQPPLAGSNSITEMTELAPPVKDLIEFSPVIEQSVVELIEEKPDGEQELQLNNQEKRKQISSDDAPDLDVYQQVKYFRRSVHEINELLDLRNSTEEISAPENIGCDSVSSDFYTNRSDEDGSREINNSYENVDININPTIDIADNYDAVQGENRARVLEILEPEEAVTSNRDETVSHENNYDSLEANEYETIEFTSDSLETPSSRDNNETSVSIAGDGDVKVQLTTNVIVLDTAPLLNDIDISMSSDKSKGDLTMCVSMVTQPPANKPEERPTIISNNVKVKHLTSKFEVQDPIGKPLPPCLRARNLKTAAKTRSLDETEFLKKAVATSPTAACATSPTAMDSLTRRKSLDENMCGFKMNTLPKSLNKPKMLPEDPDLQSHVAAHDVNLSRERIEKYKEERRKYLHDKYRSESFKENKDVLLSRLKVFKTPPSKEETIIASPESSPPPSVTASNPNITTNSNKIVIGNTNGVKARTALFENEVEMRPGSISSRRDRPNRDSAGATVESAFGVARRSFEPATRKETPSYCIKDMKAIFESKSQQ